MIPVNSITLVSGITDLLQQRQKLWEKMAYHFYKFAGKVKLCQMFPGFFSRNFFFLFFGKNLLSFWGCEEILSCLNLLSRKSPKLGRFFYKFFLLVRAAIIFSSDE